MEQEIYKIGLTEHKGRGAKENLKVFVYIAPKRMIDATKANDLDVVRAHSI